ncbi:MAG: T9SS C-terminal target domain-containing protein [Calditrichaeota bacterium]|nr:MAG: T9SS C-terminal target domain-containing protein [Calditrichota bacterium]
MKPLTGLSFLTVGSMILLMTTSVLSQLESENCTLIGRWAEGSCYTVLAEAGIVYFGNGGYLQIMDFSDPLNPTLLGRIALPSMVRRLALGDGIMGVADYYGGLRIVDISNPAVPAEIGSVGQIGSALDIAITGKAAYVAANDQGLVIIDLSDTTTPVISSRLALSGNSAAVAIRSGHAFLGCGKALAVVDIADQKHPAEIARIELPDQVNGITIKDNLAYISANQGGLRIIDISDPSHPLEIGFCLENKRLYDVKFVGNTAYAVGYQIGLYVLDVAIPSQPIKIDSLQTLKYNRQIAIEGDRLYIARSSHGVSAIDISPIRAPTLISTFKTGSYWDGVDVKGNYAYLAGGENIRIIDCANVAGPTSIGYLDVGNYDCYEVKVRDHYAYVAASGYGLEIIDVAAPAEPVIVGHTSGFDWSQGLDVSGNYAYMADYGKGLRIADISDPQSPTEVGNYDTIGLAYNVTVQEPFAFVADYDSGLCIINVADVTNPAFVARIKSTRYTMGAAARNHYIFVADGDSIKIFDISTIDRPQKIGACSSFGFARQIQLMGDYAVVANAYAEIEIFDISDLRAPKRVGFYQTGYGVNDIAVKDDLIFALDEMVGLYILRFDPPTLIDHPQTATIPHNIALWPNYPNPFNSITHFDYEISIPSRVKIVVYNLNGQLVRTLIDEEQIPGRHTALWDGSADDSKDVVSGAYLLRIQVGKQKTDWKILYLK